MPVLKNPRHELFAQRIATSPKTGLSQGQCYEAAGFKTDGRSADACAARLLTDANVRARLAELLEPAARKTRVTVESLLDELKRTIDDAREAKQHAVVVSSLTLAAKLVGLLVERAEIAGPGGFAGCETVDEVAAKMLDETSLDDALQNLDVMREAMMRIASDRAELVS